MSDSIINPWVSRYSPQIIKNCHFLTPPTHLFDDVILEWSLIKTNIKLFEIIFIWTSENENSYTYFLRKDNIEVCGHYHQYFHNEDICNCTKQDTICAPFLFSRRVNCRLLGSRLKEKLFLKYRITKFIFPTDLWSKNLKNLLGNSISKIEFLKYLITFINPCEKVKNLTVIFAKDTIKW